MRYSKKAVSWLKEHEVPFTFHDYKTKGIDKQKLEDWSRQVGWETLLNRKGTTWRKLDESTKATVQTEAQAIEIMLQNTSIIKRPVIEKDNKVVAVGFDESHYEKLK